MMKWMTKRNVAILNLILLGVFVFTLIAVAVPFVREEPGLSPVPRGRSTTPTAGGALNPKEVAPGVGREETLARIVERDLFDLGWVDPPPPPPPPPPLRLELIGVSSIRRELVAIVYDESKRQEYIVREGDEVGDHFGVRVTSITVDPASVTYNRPAVGEVRLTMESRFMGQAETEKDPWANVIRAVRPGHTYVVKVPLLREQVGSARSYEDTLGFEPNMEGTRSNGLRITSLRGSDFFYAAGLRQGDIVKTINDSPITDRASALRKLVEGGREFNIRVGIERAGTSRTLFYTLLEE